MSYKNGLNHFDKQQRRFNPDSNPLIGNDDDEDRTQSFLNKVNAHIITTHQITPDSSKNKSSMSSFGKQQQQQQNNGFFLHSNVYFQAAPMSKS